MSGFVLNGTKEEMSGPAVFSLRNPSLSVSRSSLCLFVRPSVCCS